MQNKVQVMKRNPLHSIIRISCLLPMIALFAFGCASQQPAATSQPAPKATDNYLLYTLDTKRAYSETWTLGTNSVVTAEPLRVKTKVTIARDGKVESAEIVKSSGNPGFDQSVQQTLDRVKSVQPFGADARDEQRTFVIDFELKPKL